jgi:hypothetical protein
MPERDVPGPVVWPDPAPEPDEQPDEPWGRWESQQEDDGDPDTGADPVA